jgi:hypothetical protein
MQLIFATATSAATVPPQYGNERTASTRRAMSNTLDANNFQIVDDPNVVRAMTDSNLTGADAPGWVRQLRTSLGASLSRRHVEAGYDHPSEQTLHDALEQYSADAQTVLANIVLTRGSHRGDVMRLIGRLPTELTDGWGIALASVALNDQDVDVRDAAIYALEQWGGAEAARLLSAHFDPEPWLTEYAHRVAEELNA